MGSGRWMGCWSGGWEGPSRRKARARGEAPEGSVGARPRTPACSHGQAGRPSATSYTELTLGTRGRGGPGHPQAELLALRLTGNRRLPGAGGAAGTRRQNSSLLPMPGSRAAKQRTTRRATSPLPLSPSCLWAGNKPGIVYAQYT